MERSTFDTELIAAAGRVKLLLMDCDGVLTDGSLYFSESGEALKVFHVRDGQGLVLWHNAGYESGIISGRDAGAIIAARAGELGIRYVRSGSADKVRDMEEIALSANVKFDEIAFVGDDIGDLGLLAIVGFPVAVADAVDEVRTRAAYVTHKPGGHGAVRELIDFLLFARGGRE